MLNFDKDFLFKNELIRYFLIYPVKKASLNFTFLNRDARMNFTLV